MGEPKAACALPARSALTLSCIVLMLLFLCSPTRAQDRNAVEDPPRHLNSWAVGIVGGIDRARAVAEELGLRLHSKAGTLHDVYTLVLPDVGNASSEQPMTRHRRDEDTSNSLLLHRDIQWAEQQTELRRVRRNEPSDPLYQYQWYYGQAFPTVKADLAWNQAYTGRGVAISIVDDGLETDNPDIEPNYDSKASHDYNSGDGNPTPRYTSNNINKHGTRCGGVAAGARNDVCGVGVAYNAMLGGIRMLDGPISDVVEGSSLSHQPDYIDIYSCSWGPDDDGKTFEMPGPLAQRAMAEGVVKGRNGLGSIYVWASGNGGPSDNCNCDGYANSMYSITISAATEFGSVPYYSEICAAAMATTFSSGSGTRSVVTADLHKGCTTSFTGTSAAAPMASGLLALALEANPCLTWRDMQELIVQTADPNNLKADDWQVNGAGRSVSHRFGFGVLDATALVAAAKTMHTLPNRMTLKPNIDEASVKVGHSSSETLSVTVGNCFHGSQACMDSVEHVQVDVKLTCAKRSSVSLTLTSPSGTQSQLLHHRQRDLSGGLLEWTFMTVMCWGESPSGKWKLVVNNQDRAGVVDVASWSLTIHGKAKTDYLLSGQRVAKVSKPASERKDAPSCLVCPAGTYSDGAGGCRVCSSNCTHGCFGPGPYGCSVSGILEESPDGNSDSIWDYDLSQTLVVATGILLVLTIAVYGTCKILHGKDRGRTVEEHVELGIMNPRRGAAVAVEMDEFNPPIELAGATSSHAEPGPGFIDTRPPPAAAAATTANTAGNGAPFSAAASSEHATQEEVDEEDDEVLISDTEPLLRPADPNFSVDV